MTGAWLAIAVFAVGLPALAWWLGGRRFWTHGAVAADADPYPKMVRRHGLRPAEAAVVE